MGMLLYFFPLTLPVKMNMPTRVKPNYLVALFLLENLRWSWWNLLIVKIKLLHASILVCSCSGPKCTYFSLMNTIFIALILLRLCKIVVQTEIVFTGGSQSTCRARQLWQLILPYRVSPFSVFTTDALLKLCATIKPSTPQWGPTWEFFSLSSLGNGCEQFSQT